MNKIRQLSLPLVFVLHLIPVVFQITVLFSSIRADSWRLLFSEYPLSYAIAVTLLTLLCTVFYRKVIPENGFGRVCSLLILPTALLNALTCAFHGRFLSFLLILLCCICALIFQLVSSSQKWQHVLLAFVSFVLALPVTIMIPFSYFIGNFGASTIIREVKSPDGAYTAFLIDSDQGAFGGDTVIEIMKNPLHLYFGTFTSDYHVEFDSWAGIDVLSEITFEWQDNASLLCGDSEINIAN